jgi:hypothetical protein
VAEQLLLFVPRQSRRTYICIKDTYRRVSIYIYTLSINSIYTVQYSQPSPVSLSLKSMKLYLYI